MREQPILQLEAQIEQVVEGVFARFAGRRITAHDIMLRLIRVMEAEASPSNEANAAITPDNFTVLLSPSTYKRITAGNTQLAYYLGDYVTKMAHSRGYQLNGDVSLRFATSPDLKDHELQVIASHRKNSHDSTDVMQPVSVPVVDEGISAQLVIDNLGEVQLSSALMTIGRGTQNDIDVEDKHVSRQHIQLRQRGDAFFVFDLGSRSGTFVNEIRIKEHRLKSGDVIRIGSTNMVFVQADDDSDPTPTSKIDPIL